VEDATEVPLLIKTTAQRYPEVEAAIRARHPYELPEVVAVPIGPGLPAYLAWVAAETTSPTCP
jgi:periplasmic divalent cation tolerance protein